MLTVLFITVTVVFAVLLPSSDSLGCGLLTIVLHNVQSPYHSGIIVATGKFALSFAIPHMGARIPVLIDHASLKAWNSAGTQRG